MRAFPVRIPRQPPCASPPLLSPRRERGGVMPRAPSFLSALIRGCPPTYLGRGIGRSVGCLGISRSGGGKVGRGRGSRGGCTIIGDTPSLLPTRAKTKASRASAKVAPTKQDSGIAPYPAESSTCPTRTTLAYGFPESSTGQARGCGPYGPRVPERGNFYGQAFAYKPPV